METLPSVFNRSNSTLSPLQNLARMQRQMDRLFDRLWSNNNWEPELEFTPLAVNQMFSPACNVDETDTHFLLTFDIPGVKKEDVKIELRGNTLNVFGERKEDFEKKSVNQYQSESSYGSFLRSINLPADVKADQIVAQYENGVLKVAVPKTESSKVQQIKISNKKEDIKAQH